MVEIAQLLTLLLMLLTAGLIGFAVGVNEGVLHERSRIKKGGK